LFYTSLATVDIYLMLRMIRQGPDGLGYWPPAPPSITAATSAH
jgi:cytochrome d ubiquinol oxidase subunit I